MDTIAERWVSYNGWDIIIRSDDLGNGFWFLKITVDSYSTSAVFRLDSEHLTFDQMIDFSYGKRSIYERKPTKQMCLSCTAEDGYFIFTNEQPTKKWVMSIKIPIDVIGDQIREVIYETYNKGYAFGQEITSENGSEVPED